VEHSAGKAFAPKTVAQDNMASGTVRCSYYATDVKTYLSGVLVEAYNINGATLIQFDLLGRYGDVVWDGAERALRLSTSKDLTAEEQKYVGLWGCAIASNGSLYFDLKDDGTFKELRVMYGESFGVRKAGVMTLACGNWHESEGNLYLTNRMFTSWDALNDGYEEKEQITPKKLSPWKSIDDFILKNISYIPAGTAGAGYISAPNDCFESKLEPNTPENSDRIYIFNKRNIMPVGPEKNAFDYIPLP